MYYVASHMPSGNEFQHWGLPCMEDSCLVRSGAVSTTSMNWTLQHYNRRRFLCSWYPETLKKAAYSSVRN